MRSLNTANDIATTFDVLDEVVSQYEENGQVFDNLCCIYPCVPLLKPEHIVSAYNKFSSSGDVDSLVPAVRFSFPIQRAFVADADGLLSYREPEYKNFRSQDLEPTYHDAGMFYWYRWGYFSKVKEHAVLVKTAMYEMEEKFVQDIDNQSDWDMAELKYRILKELDK
jgi:N-acylneuraminate cytidylyltransferase